MPGKGNTSRTRPDGGRGSLAEAPTGRSTLLTGLPLVVLVLTRLPLALLVLTGPPLAASGQPSGRFAFSRAAMGTEFRVVVHATDSERAGEAVEAAFGRVTELDRRLSDYRSDSEVSMLSAAAGTDRKTAVSDDLWRVLSKAQAVAQATGGAFDVTVGSVTRLWRWADRRGVPLPEPSITDALATVGYRDLHLDSVSQSVQLLQEGMRIDLGGIAKGYAADEMLQAIRSFGIASALVDAGGDIVAGDPPPGEPGWKIEVSNVDRSGHVAPEIHLLANAALATSGDTYRFLEVDGVRYSHIVDPRTGRGLTERRLVTVMAPAGMEADALASAVSVLGRQGLELACVRSDVAIRLIEYGSAGGRASISDSPRPASCAARDTTVITEHTDWFGTSQLTSKDQ